MIFNSLTFLVFFASSGAPSCAPVLAGTRRRSTCWSRPICSTRRGTRRSSCCCGFRPWSTGGRRSGWSAPKAERTRKLWMMTSVVVNIGMLGYFKYGGFLLDNFVALAASLGVHYQPPEWDIVLPVGISFYTFATLSYTLDVYLRRAKPAAHFLDYALFVTFFPHLVAGPIMRPTELVPAVRRAAPGDRAPDPLRPRADHPRPVPEGGARRRLPRAGGGEGLRRARRRARDARRLGRDAGVQRPDLLRLRRLFVDRDRGRDVPRLRDARQLPLPLCGGRLLRLLATMAHHACRAGCATISTFRWAATATARRAPTPR